MSKIIQLKDLQPKEEMIYCPWIGQLRLENQQLKVKIERLNVRIQIIELESHRLCNRRYPEPIESCIRPSSIKEMPHWLWLNR